MDLSEAMKALLYGFNVARSDWSEGEYLTTNLDETGAIIVWKMEDSIF